MNLRYLFSLFFVTLMMGIAEWSGNVEWIFPEAAALCLGLWVIDKSVWQVTQIRLLVLFVLMAAVGTAMQIWSPLPFTINVSFVFIIAAIALRLFRSSVYPAISAGILPLVINRGSWLYPLIVALLIIILCLGQRLMEYAHLRKKHDYLPVCDDRHKLFRKWCPLLLIVIMVSLISEIFSCRFIIVPPLIVTLVEFTSVHSGIRKQPLVVIGLIFCGALLGTAAQWLAQYFSMSSTLCYTIALIFLFVIFELFGRRFAPAAAILLIPAIIPAESILLFPLYVLAGASIFIFIAMTFYKEKIRLKRRFISRKINGRKD